MALSTKTQVEPIDRSDDDSGSTPAPKGPPPASPRPRSAADSSLYTTAGKAAQQESQSGLGAEGSNPQILGVQGLALIQRGIQMLNLAFPSNPGIVAVLGDITTRLQVMIPQMVNQQMMQQNPMGMLGGAMQMGMQGMQPPAAPGVPAPPQGMGGPGMGAPMGGPSGPPVPPVAPPPVR